MRMQARVVQYAATQGPHHFVFAVETRVFHETFNDGRFFWRSRKINKWTPWIRRRHFDSEKEAVTYMELLKDLPRVVAETPCFDVKETR